MIVVMQAGASAADVERVDQIIREQGMRTRVVNGDVKSIVCVLGATDRDALTKLIEPLPGVEHILTVLHPFKLASREFHPADTIVPVGERCIGGPTLAVIAGPCSVENEEMLQRSAEAIRAAGVGFLRGAIFKPRTSPYAFQGLREKGLEILARVRERTGLAIVTEVLAPEHVPVLAEFADVLQVGARNMQNFALLTELGHIKHPVLLKRGFSNTVTEWLTAADYLLAGGNSQVILCERGIRTFEETTRFSLDIGSIPVVKKFSHLPVIVDPSHAAGHYSLVPAIAKAAVAAGADGLLIEVHPKPKEALVDGLQSLTPSDFSRLMKELKAIAQAIGRYI